LLLPPTILHSNNHIVVVNKPPGWHSVPNNYDNSVATNDKNNNNQIQKCLLTHLQDTRQGGGTLQKFLKPVHRIDQPCSGIMIWAKTTKAAERLAKVWKAKQVIKTYVCLIPTKRLDNLMQQSSQQQQQQQQPTATTTKEAVTAAAAAAADVEGTTKYDDDDNNHNWWNLEGYQHRRNKNPSNSTHNAASTVVGWNVIITSTAPNHLSKNVQQHNKVRPVSILWKHVPVAASSSSSSSSSSLRTNSNNEVSVILVRTRMGARHMVRAILAQVGQCPIIGDRRYGSIKNQLFFRSPQHFQVVGLHAYSIQLPTTQLQLGPQNAMERYFQAPLPEAWDGMLGSDVSLQMIQNAINISLRP